MKRALLNFLILVLAVISVGSLSAPLYAAQKNTDVHITIVGEKDNKIAYDLNETAKKNAPNNSSIEWVDRKAIEHSGGKIPYPVLDKPAAYVCVMFKCSLPAFTSEKLILLLSKIPSNTETSNEAGKFSNILKSTNPIFILPLFWFFGLLLSLTPCLLPLMLIITSIIGGSSESITKTRAFTLSITYILSLAITYATAGLVAAKFGFYLQGYLQNPWVIGVFSGIFILLAISLFGFFNIQLPGRWRKRISGYTKTQKSGSYIGVALMGMMATLIASPCVAAPLAGILAYIADTGDTKFGALALFSTGIGIGTPVLIVNMIGIELLQKLGDLQKYVKQFFGIMLLGIAIWMLGRILPPQLTMLMWSALSIFTAIYMGALDRQPLHAIDSHHHDKLMQRLKFSLNKMISLMILVYGGALLAGALIGNTNPLAPLSGAVTPSYNKSGSDASFKNILDIEQLRNEIKIAGNENKPVFLIFSAAWCTACKEIEESVLPHKNIQNVIRNFTTLKIDLTKPDENLSAITEYFKIIGPPVIILFNGDIDRSSKIDGEIDVDNLTEKMKKHASE